jgi:hypothetical protein
MFARPMANNRGPQEQVRPTLAYNGKPREKLISPLGRRELLFDLRTAAGAEASSVFRHAAHQSGSQSFARRKTQS